MKQVTVYTNKIYPKKLALAVWQQVYLWEFMNPNHVYTKIILDAIKLFGKDICQSLVELFPDVLGSISVETFTKAINKVEPSLIRVDADEVTYPLHIMVRYEMEKELMEHAFDINDLPKRWADKYEEYVGVRPTTDANGILQDVHWSEGLFGYFPSYALGSAYAAQFEHAMQKDLDVLDCLEEGKNGGNPCLALLTYSSIRLHTNTCKDY